MRVIIFDNFFNNSFRLEDYLLVKYFSNNINVSRLSNRLFAAFETNYSRCLHRDFHRVALTIFRSYLNTVVSSRLTPTHAWLQRRNRSEIIIIRRPSL